MSLGTGAHLLGLRACRDGSAAHKAMTTADSTLLFVYGTLMRGGCRSAAIAGQRCRGTARTQARYRMYDCGGYPGLVEAGQGISIRGELWEVDAACLARLDLIEGVPEQWYARRPIALQPPFADDLTHAYFYLPSTRHLRECGAQWINRLGGMRG